MTAGLPVLQASDVQQYIASLDRIEVVLLDRKDLPSAGAGEIGIIGLAPAVGNAIFAASGMRLRNMPLAPRDAVPGGRESAFRS